MTESKKLRIIDSPYFWPVFAIVSVVIGVVIFFVCRGWLEPPKDTEIGLPVLVAYGALVAIVVQIVINIRQWEVTKDGLVQTRELFEMAERPSISIETIGFVQDELGGFALQISVVNSGRAPAIDFRSAMAERYLEPVSGACPDPTTWKNEEKDEFESLEVIGIASKRIIPGSKLSRGDAMKLGPRREQDMFIFLQCTYSDPRRLKIYRLDGYWKFDRRNGVFKACQIQNYAD